MCVVWTSARARPSTHARIRRRSLVLSIRISLPARPTRPKRHTTCLPRVPATGSTPRPTIVVSLCKDHGMDHRGRKADLISRLEATRLGPTAEAPTCVRHHRDHSWPGGAPQVLTVSPTLFLSDIVAPTWLGPTGPFSIPRQRQIPDTGRIG